MSISFAPPHHLPTNPLLLDGASLTIPDVVAVARKRRRVAIAPAARERVTRCRVLVDVLLAAGRKVYGLTTGFGQLRDVMIPAEDARQLQLNLIRSHAAGVGAPFDEDVVRAAMLLRVNTLCRGNSGIRPETLEVLVAMLNDDVYPFVPQQGSVGACGDLAPLSHLALAVVGDTAGRYLPRTANPDWPRPMRGARPEAFVAFPEAAGFADAARTQDWSTFRPATLAAKEGLALNNGTNFMTAALALTCYDASFTLRWSEAVAAISCDAHQGQPSSLDPRIHAARPQAGQPAVAERLRLWLQDSQLVGCELNVGQLGAAIDELQTATATAAPAARPRLAAFLPRALALVPRRPDGSIDDAGIARLRASSGAEQIAALRPQAMALADDLERTEPPLLDRPLLRRIADRLRRVVAESPHVQDDYSLRCFPVVAAATWRALQHTVDIVTCELNAATDNPLLFPPEPLPGESAAAWRARLAADLPACERAVVGGGNFHGHPIAAVSDYLAVALAALGNACERRLAHLVDAQHSRGLPGFLTRNGGLNSGFMLAQYTAAALVAENKVLCHPASVDSIPTCANTEDWVSMGTLAARKATEVQRQVETIVAIELAAAAHALLFRPFLRPAPRVDALATRVRARCNGGQAPTADDGDRPLQPVLAAAQACLRDPELLDQLL